MARPHRSDLLGACLVVVAFLPFLFTLHTFFVSDDLQMVVFGKTMSPGAMDWLPSSRWAWHRPLPAFRWIFAARPSGTEDVYKIYAESFRGRSHLKRIQADARTIVSAAIRPSTGA